MSRGKKNKSLPNTEDMTMNMKLSLCGVALICLSACRHSDTLQAPTVYGSANPYLPVWEYIPDGEPYVFEDPDQPGKYRVYVYGSHDRLVTSYCGRDQVVWSAPVEDLDDWRFDGTIFVLDKDANGEFLYPDSVGEVLFAPDVVEAVDEAGRKVYYLYPNVQNHLRSTAVARSNRPDGPFEVCNWDPAEPKKTVGSFTFDPAVFIDDDGRVYGYWGFDHSYGAELDPATMATVKPGTQVVEDMIPGHYQEGVERFYEASSIRKIKDKYVFVYSRWTLDGENGLPESNYTLAYCYSQHPLGPWTYGGTIIDARAREIQEDGTTIATACPNGNTHGSLCEIGGQWYVFYHRQSGTDEYSRQAMVAPVSVEVKEGPEGYVNISEGEYTSEGFHTGGLDPFKRYPAGIACYYVGPKPAVAEYPRVHYNGPHISVQRLDVAPIGTNPYDVSLCRNTVVDTFDGSMVGYKYFDFDKLFAKKDITLVLNWIGQGVAGTMDICVDQPGKGGVKVATISIPAKVDYASTSEVCMDQIRDMKGKHSLFFVFHSPTKEQSICELVDFWFQTR